LTLEQYEQNTEELTRMLDEANATIEDVTAQRDEALELLRAPPDDDGDT
jgi:hypothetical protein